MVTWGRPIRAVWDTYRVRVRFYVNGYDMGSIIWFNPAGPFYPLTQVRRFGPVADFERAKMLVEMHAVSDVLAWPTKGNA